MFAHFFSLICLFSLLSPSLLLLSSTAMHLFIRVDSYLEIASDISIVIQKNKILVWLLKLFQKQKSTDSSETGVLHHT